MNENEYMNNGYDQNNYYNTQGYDNSNGYDQNIGYQQDGQQYYAEGYVQHQQNVDQTYGQESYVAYENGDFQGQMMQEQWQEEQSSVKEKPSKKKFSKKSSKKAKTSESSEVEGADQEVQEAGKKKSKKKKEKKEKEPQYFNSAVNIPVLNYNVYYMSIVEKILYFLIAFAVGAAVAYVFYGGMFSDSEGNPTNLTKVSNTVIMCVLGTAAGLAFLPMKTKSIIKKRKNNLRLQFREFLDSVATSLGSGSNVMDSYRNAYVDLQAIYNKEDFIIKELEVIVAGLDNNVEVEAMLEDLGVRSGNDDIKSFANVFRTCYRTGGNIKDVIKSTQEIITSRMEVEMEIETMISGSKNEMNTMMVMPVIIIAMIKSMSAEMATKFTSGVGLASTTVAVVMFVVAYLVGRSISDIKA